MQNYIMEENIANAEKSLRDYVEISVRYRSQLVGLSFLFIYLIGP